MQWFQYDIVVPFGDTRYDTLLGGSHDLTIGAPPNMAVTALLPGTVSDVSSPSWGRQVCLKLDTEYNGVPFMAYLHLSATNPSLRPGVHVGVGELIGWVGGANEAQQYNGTSNPTGENFLNSPEMSSRVQVGVALHRGPSYGGLGWQNFPPIDRSLDPTKIIEEARTMAEATTNTPAVQPTKKDSPFPVPEIDNLQLTTRANDAWSALNGSYPADTGIAGVWLSCFVEGVFLGAPTTGEVSWTNSNGKTGVCQFFQYGRIEDCPRGSYAVFNALNQRVR